jgi:ribosomal protein S18 acetylase RimI-like enzyme
MYLRRLVLADLDAYYANRLRALADSPSAFLTTWEEESARGNAHFAETLADRGEDRAIFGAVEGAEVVGSVGVFRESRPKTRHKAVIWGVYVDPAHRGQGIAGRLLDLAIEQARDRMRVKTVLLTLETAGKTAKRLYESRGFKHWGTEPLAMGADGIYESEDHMVLILG